MRPILTSSQKAASALRRAEKSLRNWQDDPDSPRADVDKMLTIIADLRSWVQGHVMADIENATGRPSHTSVPHSNISEPQEHVPREHDL